MSDATLGRQLRESARFVLALLFLACLNLATVKGQTAYYSDMWGVDGSGATYNPNDDSETVPENPVGPSYLVACGVTETDYNSVSQSLGTTFSGPAGSVSGMSYDSSYARVELTLDLPPLDDGSVEHSYQVKSNHKYRVYEPDYTASRGNSPAYVGAAARRIYWRYYSTYTSLLPVQRWVSANYEFSGHWWWNVNSPTRTCRFNKVCGSCGPRISFVFGFITTPCPNYMTITFWQQRWPWATVCISPRRTEYGFWRQCL